MEKKIFILEGNTDISSAYKFFEEEIKANPMYDKVYNKSVLGIEEMYIAYYFFDTNINDLPYFFVNNETGQKYNGKIDVSCLLNDSAFLLNGLNKEDFKEINDAELNIYNKKDYGKKHKLLINKIKDKTMEIITKRHNLKKNKNIYIDVAPIEEINSFKLSIYYEKVYVIRYKYSSFRKEYICILSDYNQRFYQFDFNKSIVFLEFLKKYRTPIEPIPKDYLNDYYKEAFKVYLNTLKKLEYESYRGLLKKIKNNIDYEEYNLYIDYLTTGIFYFRIKKYLKRLNINDENIRKRIMLSYLTLNYQKSSGLFLYECAKLNLLNDSSTKRQISFLQKSFYLGSLEAKKLLYDHYNEPIYYDEQLIKRYS